MIAALSPRERRERTARVGVVRGMAGVGKTAVALRAAHELSSTFPDGCVYRDLGGDTVGLRPTRGEDLLEWLLRHLQVDCKTMPATMAERAALYQGRMRGKRILLVLDNVRSTDQVEQAIPSAPECAVIITTRHRLAALDAALHIDLPPLQRHDAQNLLRELVPPENPAGEPRDDRDVEQVVERCGDLPLAIHVAAGMYRRKPHLGLSGVREHLTARPGGLRALTDGERSVDVVLRAALGELGEPERRTFRLLSLHPGQRFTPAAVAALGDTSVVEAERQLDKLWDVHLLTPGGGERYGMHDLLRDLGTHELAAAVSSDERDAASRRLTELYIGLADAADSVVAPHRNRMPLPDHLHRFERVSPMADATSALEWFEEEETALVSLVRSAFERCDDEYCWHLAHILRGYFFLTCRFEPWISTHEYALECARRSGNIWWEATTRNNLGLAYAMRGDLEPASHQYELALELFTELDDEVSASHTLGHQAWIHHLEGDYVASVDKGRTALAVYRRTSLRRNAAIMLREIAGSLASLRRMPEASSHLESAIAEFRSLGLDLDLAMALNTLAEVHLRSDDVDAAEARFHEAAGVARMCGSCAEEARAFRGLGDTAIVQGRRGEAYAHWSSALTLLDDLDLPGAVEVRAHLDEMSVHYPETS
ncbi:tetratricopeptide repeat protein [Nocardia sp. NPDC050713]|uniref:tetratricopeptide repeat protein n=1 Tax=Nocardia sp. NPDC050713 TaxID=3154511 RepID=UPI0033F76135